MQAKGTNIVRVLITGAAGSIGRIVARGLNKSHHIRGFDLAEMPEIKDNHIGDLTDYDAVYDAVVGTDAIVHLGGLPGGDDWNLLLKSNFIGTYNVFEAMRHAKVKRIAYASRAGIFSHYPKSLKRTAELIPRPVGHYTVSKVFGESLAYSYSHQHGLECVCIRIGNFKLERDLPEHPHHLSHGDCIRVFERAITQENLKFETVFGVSASNWPMYDLEHGKKKIGYIPQDASYIPEEHWEE